MPDEIHARSAAAGFSTTASFRKAFAERSLIGYHARVCGDYLPALAYPCPNTGEPERTFEMLVRMASSKLHSDRDDGHIADP
jgi:hypothetical protein